jgi:hypothetical protein
MHSALRRAKHSFIICRASLRKGPASTSSTSLHRWIGRLAGVLVAAVGLATTAGAGIASASSPQNIAYGQVNRLVESTGNLYWTSNVVGSGSDVSTVWRMSQLANAGQKSPLYTVSSSASDPISFGDLTYAEVGGTWYGYFVVNEDGVSRIDQVALAPGGANVAATLSTGPPCTALCAPMSSELPNYVGNDDLLTDGANLYWVDGDAVWRMPIGGGTPAQLASGSSLGSHLALAGGYLYYSQGSSVWRIPVDVTGTGTATIGHPPSAFRTSSAMITALAVSSDTVYWGDSTGSVYSSPLSTNTIVERAHGDGSGAVSGISVDGSDVLFGDCGYHLDTNGVAPVNYRAGYCYVYRAPVTDSSWDNGGSGHLGFGGYFGNAGSSTTSAASAGYRIQDGWSCLYAPSADVIGDVNGIFFGDAENLNLYQP